MTSVGHSWSLCSSTRLLIPRLARPRWSGHFPQPCWEDGACPRTDTFGFPWEPAYPLTPIGPDTGLIGPRHIEESNNRFSNIPPDKY
ncbi:hypothetical protein M378DRAFT_171293 [Amanita muscaria Koide BX008]|uniref:Uncharacterized protein n=1 Tax=Amanita muscaria (strain Koide BX008) TaxID=946122 RepID=A0A0C2WM45_AMAMK|nr:hypothetical protein M378DRAFT_171293 [Amanita muscaria Koide BX008]